jgi:hypothetical protein
LKQLIDTTFAEIRGFNYVPSYAATIWDVLDNFDPVVWDRELGYSKRFGSNTLRVWCDVLSFLRDETVFIARWRRALDIAERHDLRLMITLANRWGESNWPFGQIDYATVLNGEPSREYRRYLTTFASTFRTDERIVMWDLCNEPFGAFAVPKNNDPLTGTRLRHKEMGFDYLAPGPAFQNAELSFWRGAAEAIREAGATQPITIGLHPVEGCAPYAIHEVVDVISCHPYSGWWEGGRPLGELCDEYVELANGLGKPLLCTETCQGSLSNETRREIINVTLKTLEQRKIGWLAWGLMAGRMVSLRWDRPDLNCRPGDESVMYWVEPDGTTRPGHDVSEWRDW